MNTGGSFTGQLPTRVLAAIFAALLIGAILFAVVSSRNKRPAMQEAFSPAKPARATSTFAAAAPTRTPTPTQKALATTGSTTTEDLSCTYLSDYWKDHPQAWMLENIVIGRFSYTKKEAAAVLSAAPENLRSLVLKQFFTAALNISAGVDASVVSDILAQASAWFDTLALKIDLTPEEASQGETLARALEGYNNGITGPGACPGQEILPFTSLIPTTTTTATIAPTILQPASAATQSSVKPPPQPPRGKPSGGGQPTAVPPPAPTQAPPPAPTPQPRATQPPPRPTQPPPPEPTSAPPEPTDAPKPTKEPKPTKPPKSPVKEVLFLPLILPRIVADQLLLR